MVDSVNTASISIEQASQQTNLQVPSSPKADTMIDSFKAANLNDNAEHQTKPELPSSPIASITTDSVNNSFLHSQADQNASLELLSTSATITQTQEPGQTLEATTAVAAALGTTELLLLIISEVPLYYRAFICRVSKSWQGAVEKVGYAHEPTDYVCWKGEEIPSIPVQLVKRRFRFCHPEFHRQYDEQRYNVRRVSLCLSLSEKFPSLKHEFITHPPITQALICVNEALVGAFGNGQVASLRVRGGIKIGDLLEYLEKLDVEVLLYLSIWS